MKKLWNAFYLYPPTLKDHPRATKSWPFEFYNILSLCPLLVILSAWPLTGLQRPVYHNSLLKGLLGSCQPPFIPQSSLNPFDVAGADLRTWDISVTKTGRVLKELIFLQEEKNNKQ